MTPNINDGGPAFPVPTPDSTDGRTHDGGLTLRDFFAGMALQGMLANNETAYAPRATAPDCYAYADAMIAARDGEEQP